MSSFVRRALTPVLALFKSAIHTTYLTPDRDYTLKHLRQNHRMCARNSWLMIDVGDDMCISVEVLIICDNLLIVNSLRYCSLIKKKITTRLYGMGSQVLSLLLNIDHQLSFSECCHILFLHVIWVSSWVDCCFAFTMSYLAFEVLALGSGSDKYGVSRILDGRG